MREFRRADGLRLVPVDEIAARGEREVARVAAVQRGVISVAQLQAAGLGHEAIRRRVRGGRLHRHLHGVYLVGHPGLAPMAPETAALLALGRGAVLSHHTAARLHGLLPRGGETSRNDQARAGVLDVTVVGRRPRRRAGIASHSTPALAEDDRVLREGLPATAVARTLADLAACAGEELLDRIVAEALATRRATTEDIERAMSRATDRRGHGLLRELLDGGGGFVRSGGERALLGLIVAAGLPRPEVNVRLGAWEADFVWRDARLVIELDGRDGHSSAWARDRDARKSLELERAGWRVVRITGRQLARRPEWLLAQLGGLLLAGAARPRRRDDPNRA